MRGRSSPRALGGPDEQLEAAEGALRRGPDRPHPKAGVALVADLPTDLAAEERLADRRGAVALQHVKDARLLEARPGKLVPVDLVPVGPTGGEGADPDLEGDDRV